MSSFLTSDSPVAIIPTEINRKTKIVNATKQREKRERRAVKEGFPIKEKFTNEQQIRDYLHGEKITCLLCGRTLKALCAHLSIIHKMPVDDYKEMYGLPYKCGLSSAPTKELCRENGKRPEQIAHMKTLLTPENRAKCLAAAKTQRISGLKRMATMKNISKAKLRVPKFDASHGEAILSYMEEHDCSVTKAVNDTGIMKETAFYKLIKRHPELNAYHRISKGTRGVRSPLCGNPDALDKIRKMREEGKTFKEIGVEIGIHEEYAGKLWRTKIKNSVTANSRG